MAQNIRLTDPELESILAEVERDLAVVLKSEQDKLQKAQEDGDGDDKGSAPPSDGGSDDASASAPPSDDSGSAPPEASSPDASAGGPPPADAASASADPAAADGSAGPMDMDSLKAEYASLPPEELKMHYLACKQALLEVMQQGAGAGASPDPSAPPGASPSPDAGSPPPGPPAGAASPSPSAPPGPPAAPMSPSPSPDQPPPAMKGEMKASPANGGGKPKMAKSEDEKDAKIADLEQQVTLLAKAVDLALATPQRKAVTSVGFLAKTEDKPADKQLSRDDIKARLSEVAKRPNLAKSDRDLINKFCVGTADASAIAHLLK